MSSLLLQRPGLAAGVLFLCVPLIAAPSHLFPKEQTVDGVTIRIKDSHWINSQQVGPHIGSYVGGNESVDGLGLWYDVQTQNAHAKHRLNIYPVGPGGRFSGQDWEEGDGLIWWKDVDSRWPKITATFEFLAAAAPEGADGHFEEMMQLKDIPLPEKTNEPLALHRVLTTTHGNQLILESVETTPLVGQGVPLTFGSVRFIVNRVRSGTVQDMSVDFGPRKIVDEKGRDWGKGAFTFDDNHPGREVVIVDNQPFLHAKSLTVNVQIHEYAPSLRQEKWMRYLRFELDPRRTLQTTPR